MADLKRLNTNIPKDIYDWIDEESKRTGVLKSNIVYVALKTYIDQQRMLTMASQIDVLNMYMEQFKQGNEASTEKGEA